MRPHAPGPRFGNDELQVERERPLRPAGATDDSVPADYYPPYDVFDLSPLYSERPD